MIESIGDRIKNRRKLFKLSVDELAEIIGKNRATIYRYESNEIENMSITILEPLAKALHTTPAELCGWDNNNLTAAESSILSDFRSLNAEGQKAAAKIVKSFTIDPDYAASPETETPAPGETEEEATTQSA